MEKSLSIIKDSFKELPNNIEAEQSVIGSILVSNEIFDDINTNLPPVNTAFKVQRKAKTINLSYKNYDEALDDLISEINELKEAKTLEEKKSELGDVYFSLINVSRFLEADPEIQLKKSIQTFIGRAKYVEDNLDENSDINELWSLAKKNQID